MDKSTAMNLLKNTFIDYTLINGDTVKLTLAFAMLKALEAKNPDLVSRYYKTAQKKESEFRDLDMVTIIYTAYACTNLDNEDALDEEVFTILMGSDRLSMQWLSNRLMGAKKKPGSLNHS